MVHPIFFIHECIRDQLQRFGAKGILALKTFHAKCDNQRCMDINTWREFLRFSGLRLNPEELAVLMRTHATAGKEFQFGAFMECVRGTLNNYRDKLVKAAWKKLDMDNVGYVTRDCLKETYNLIAQPMVMVQQQTQEEAMVEWLNGSFALIQKVTLFDFTEYYLLLGASIPDDVDFELLFIKAWKIRGDGYNVDKALNNVKTQVYKNRNRIREFFRDYDPLRHRLIIDEQFAAALDNSKLIISKQEMKAIIDNYRMNDDPMRRTCWTAFCDEIDTVYTLKELEKTPLRNVLPIPNLEGLKPQRFLGATVYLEPKKEAALQVLLKRIRKELYDRRIYLRGSFDDYAVPKLCVGIVGHVTYTQFAQALSSYVMIRIEPEEIELLCEKYDDLKNKTVNFLAFTTDIDPPP
ncbi:hypothetical protein BDL97_01G156600 [Sphagnum fallax]|uniref:EF-hand domain-containing protein n=1 Tax=Sphagnum jensenii TaxID=128206 RepID=A0ABP0VSH9_9BRYO|nr:hypothetical protein BDL97_01G156600 [Sphagnum fallax]